MKLRELLEKSGLESLKIKPPFLEMEWTPEVEDKQAAWELYVELLTRIVTQPLKKHEGIEKSALHSAYSLFPTTRDILKSKGRNCSEFSKIAIIVLNQIVRPFTAKWHVLSEQGALKDPNRCAEFREDLWEIQTQLKKYTSLLANISDVEDFTEMEEIDV